MGKYIRGKVDETLALTTLAANTLVSVSFDETVNERTLISSIVASYSLSNFTPAADVGPFIVGVSHGDYSEAEIEEWIENAGSWNEGNLVDSREIGNRWIKEIGQLEVAEDATKTAVMNDGKPIKTKLNWILTQGQTLRLWVHNRGTAAVATTVPDVLASGHANLWPK